ncbi:excitatory amino acid transporter 3-like [Clytia hemisphaerica]|uniref:Amino acid transporter n=1 Tax=Clytia hemisphaerica TaxID=252671 RepID=A0A7M5WW99_9CNID|eukprot:TCONS_00019019-protein
MGKSEDKGLLNRGGGETINLRETSPEGSLCKDGGESSTSSLNDNAPWYIRFWRREKLMIFIIIGVCLGFLVGISCNKPIQNLDQPIRKNVLLILGFPGELLMRMLKMLILPLIVSSLIVGLAELDQRASGRLGKRAVLYYMGTTMCAVILGIILVVAIYPGGNKQEAEGEKEDKRVRPLDSFLDLIRNMFPDNLVKACIAQLVTGVKFEKHDERTTVWSSNETLADQMNWNHWEVNQTALQNQTNSEWKYLTYQSVLNGTNVTMVKEWREVKMPDKPSDKGSTNVLGLVVFSIVVGLMLGKMGKKGRVFVDWMIVLNDIVMELVGWVMWYSPIGIWSLISAKFASMNDIEGTFEKLALYMVTVIVGLIIHSFLVLPAIFAVVTRKNPFRFATGLIKALLTAFGTSSSSATLPVTFSCLEDNLRVDKRVTRFVLPIGATINMDGTALYEAVGAIFIAQNSGLDLDFGQYVAVSLTATLASIGAAGIPQAGLVTMLIVLQTIGLPEDAVTLILAVDWFLDRVRTTVNVLGDAYGAGIVHHLSQRELQQMDEDQKALDEVHRVEEGFENFTGKHDENPPNMNMYNGLTAL